MTRGFQRTQPPGSSNSLEDRRSCRVRRGELKGGESPWCGEEEWEAEKVELGRVRRREEVKAGRGWTSSDDASEGGVHRDCRSEVRRSRKGKRDERVAVRGRSRWEEEEVGVRERGSAKGASAKQTIPKPGGTKKVRRRDAGEV